MTPSSNIQELSIVLTTLNHNPILLNSDLLSGSGIIPLEWELAHSPVINAAAIAFDIKALHCITSV